MSHCHPIPHESRSWPLTPGHRVFQGSVGSVPPQWPSLPLPETCSKKHFHYPDNRLGLRENNIKVLTRQTVKSRRTCCRVLRSEL